MDSIIILGICIVIAILIAFSYIKDKHNDDKMKRFETTISEQMQEIFLLKKENSQLRKSFEELNICDFGDIIDRQIEEKITPIVLSLQSVDELIKKSYIKDCNQEFIISEFTKGKTPEVIAAENDIELEKIKIILKLQKLI